MSKPAVAEPARRAPDACEMPREVREQVIAILAAALVAHTRRHPERYGLAETKAQATGSEVAR